MQTFRGLSHLGSENALVLQQRLKHSGHCSEPGHSVLTEQLGEAEGVENGGNDHTAPSCEGGKQADADACNVKEG